MINNTRQLSEHLHRGISKHIFNRRYIKNSFDHEIDKCNKNLELRHKTDIKGNTSLNIGNEVVNFPVAVWYKFCFALMSPVILLVNRLLLFQIIALICMGCVFGWSCCAFNWLLSFWSQLLYFLWVFEVLYTTFTSVWNDLSPY